MPSPIDKDNDLHELIKDLVAVAKAYAHTTHLEKEISDLVVPLACEKAYLSGFQKGAEERIESLNAMVSTQRIEIGRLKRRIEILDGHNKRLEETIASLQSKANA